MITGLWLYVPLTVYGYVRLLQSGQSPVATAIIAFAVGASYGLLGHGDFTAGGLGERRWNECARQRPTRAMASGSAGWAPEGPLLLPAKLLLSKLTKQVSQEFVDRFRLPEAHDHRLHEPGLDMNTATLSTIGLLSVVCAFGLAVDTKPSAQSSSPAFQKIRVHRQVLGGRRGRGRLES